VRACTLIHAFEQLGLPVQLRENADLRTQDLGDDRDGHVVHRAHLIAADAVGVGDMYRGDKDDRRLAEAGMTADHLGQLEAVEIGHADIDENETDVILEKSVERPLGAVRHDKLFIEVAQNDLIADELRRLVVDEKNLDLLAILRRLAHYRWSQMRRAERSCSVFTGFAK
jgi:hypothetical protein